MAMYWNEYSERHEWSVSPIYILELQIDPSGLFIKVDNIKVLTSNPRKFVGTHSENFQFLSGTLFTLLSEVFLDFGNTSVWF